MVKITAREDFRRDGLAANFRADGRTLIYAANSIPGSKINIGYPVICEAERKICKDIASYAKDSRSEMCLVGHTRTDNFPPILSIVNKYPQNTSVNFWLPISDYFIEKTIKTSKEIIYSGLIDIVKKWKLESDVPLDIAFVDATANEKNLPVRIEEWARKIKECGVRDIILCDSRGIANPESIENIFSHFSDIIEYIEFHPHNDNALALANIDIGIKMGVTKFGTAFYKSGERFNMTDPRDLISRGLEFDQQNFEKFDARYREIIGDPKIIIPKVYQNPTVVTGTQYRLRGRAENLIPKLGVTSDVYIAKMLLGKNISSNELAQLKEKLFYQGSAIVLDKEELSHV